MIGSIEARSFQKYKIRDIPPRGKWRERRSGSREQQLGQPLSPEMLQMYQDTVASSREHFNRMQPLIEKLPPTARILCINTTKNYPTQLPEFSLLDPERQALTLEATFGDRETPRERRSAADAFRYMFGFQPGDPRFEIWNPLEAEAKKPERDPMEYDAVVVTGSEQMVTYLRKMTDLYNIPDPGILSPKEIEEMESLARRLQKSDPPVIMWDRVMKFIAKWDETSDRIGLFVCFGHQLYNEFKNANPNAVLKSMINRERMSNQEIQTETRKGKSSVNWMRSKDNKQVRVFGPVTITVVPEAQDQPLLRGMKTDRRKITVWSSHLQHLEKFPQEDWYQPLGKLISEATVLGRKVNSPYQMVAYDDLDGDVLTTQYHPELNVATIHVLADLRLDTLKREKFDMRKFVKVLRRNRKLADNLRDTIAHNLITLVTEQHGRRKTKIDADSLFQLHYAIDNPHSVPSLSLWRIFAEYYPDDLSPDDISAIIARIRGLKEDVTSN